LFTAGVAGGGPTAVVEASHRLAAMAATSQDMAVLRGERLLSSPTAAG
jgi:hypothetical protein